MSSTDTKTPLRPRVKSTQSFPRLDTNLAEDPTSPSRVRANTVHTPKITAVPEAKRLKLVSEGDTTTNGSDIFVSTESIDEDAESIYDSVARPGLAIQTENLENLPIEIRSFTDR